MTKIVKKNILQDNFITNANYDLSSMAKEAFLMMLKELKKDDDPLKSYYISTRDWANIKNVQKLHFTEVSDAIDELRNKDIIITKENGNILKTKFVSSVEYIKGTGLIEISIDKKIRPFFFDLKSNFTSFQLDMAMSLRSKYAKRLYELLSEDKRIKTKKYSVHELKSKFLLDIPDPKTGKLKHSRWSDFEANVLKTPQKQINADTDLSFTYKAVSLEGGKRKSHIIFDITYKGYQQKFEFQDSEKDIVDRMLNEFKLSKKQVNTIMQSYNETEIKKMFYKIKTEYNPKRGGVGAYSAKLFGV